MSGLFGKCKSLIQIPDISHLYKGNKYNIDDDPVILDEELDYFYECEGNFDSFYYDKVFNGSNQYEKKDVPSHFDNKYHNYYHNYDIKKDYISKYGYILYMFYECSSLTILPDISEWNISNINDISFMFYNCSSLIQLPDISKWDTHNIKDMNSLFC